MSVEKSTELTWFKSSYSTGQGGECIEIALTWRKSSYSSGDGGQCVEVALPWRASSYSSGDGGECVEIAACPTTIHIRDSKQPPATAPTLAVPAAAWESFVGFAART
ncbi:DUF397 domain-containing protein [Streptomyces sp. NBC_00083]|uniref:DUF397 domain-containing protein n=1 Tax=Streptomyces sp. NBC_00083 TaxID=2975647 RepID=UPI00225A1EE0|nr:DUF397 domain-containing protein [Streptomyces sp. NBC_00083]MCX5387802.1 DUF397 domain-containing protein [Streptomyces sp. NBC_00083]